MLLAFLAPTVAVAPELAPLSAIVGTWKMGDVVSKCDWSPAHRYVICDQKGNADGKPIDALSIYGYSSSRKQYVFFVEPEGVKAPFASTLRIEGKSWTYLSNDPGDAKRWKTTNTFLSADRYEWKVWSSSDGEHWNVTKSGESMRLK